jgi:hypothetical protein
MNAANRYAVSTSSRINFLADMGPQPEGKTLHRKNNDLGYSPENCERASRKEQALIRKPPWAPTLRRLGIEELA